MSLRTLLVPLTGTDSDAAALRAALVAARPFSAHVQGLYVRIDARDAVPLLGDGMSGAVVEDIMRAAEADSEAHAIRARETFRQIIAQNRILEVKAPLAVSHQVTATWSEETGRDEEVIAQEGRLHDLVVFANAPHGGDQRLLLEAALLGTARPLLLAPHHVPSTIGARVALAWNGGVESARAVAGAMPFLEQAQAVHILTAQTAVTNAEAAERLAAYLAWHGVRPEISTIRPGAEVVGAALLEQAARLDADLLVMGGYGHSRMRELILGGVTRHVLGHARLPVLMAH